MHEAALSRPALFERFSRAVGVAAMQYLPGWRTALAKDLLRRNEARVAEIAERVGLAPRARSASRTRVMSGTRYLREQPERGETA